MSTTLPRTGLRAGLNDTTDNSSAAEFNYVHRWIETQGIGALLALGERVISGFEVTADSGLNVAISAGIAVAESSTYGAALLQRESPYSMVLAANSTLYIFPTLEVSGSNDSRQTGLPLFVADEGTTYDGGPAIARVVTGASTITSIEDLRALDATATDGAFTQDVDNTDGLDFGYFGGIVQNGATVTIIPDGTVTLTDDTLNYVEVDADGVVSANTAGWTSGSEALYEATTADGEIVTVTPRAPDLQLGGGVSSFNDLTDVPTTLAGYGITDAASDAELAAEVATLEAADTTLQTNIDAVADDLAAHAAETDPHAGVLPLDGSRAMTGDLDFGGNRGVNGAEGVDPTDFVIMSQLAIATQGFIGKGEAKACATTNVNISNPGTSAFDNVTLGVGEILLLAGQTTSDENWLYTFNGPASALTRAVNANTDAEVVNQAAVFVPNGTDNRGIWYIVTPDPITLDTTGLDVQRWTDGNGTGEANTISNAGTEGISLVDGKNGVDLSIYGAASMNNLLTIVRNVATKTARFTVNIGNFLLQDMGGLLPGTKGGTGKSTNTQHALIVGGTSNNLTEVTPNATTTRKFVRQNGDGTNATAPVLDTLLGNDLPAFGPSGGSHSRGAVPDPGATAGNTRYLNEDGTFKIPPGSGGYNSTSTTSTSIAASTGGTKSFYVGTGYAYSVGDYIYAAVASDTSKYQAGEVTAYSAGTVSFTVREFAGSGVYNDWVLGQTGRKGTAATGGGDVTGPASAVDSDIVAFDGVTGKLIKSSGSTAAGRALLTAADAAAQKTALGLVKGDVGLGSVDNTADTAKPVSTAQQTALDLKAPLASPALTGTPTAPTPSAADNSTKIATTAYVDTGLAAKAATSHTHNASDINAGTLDAARLPTAQKTRTLNFIIDGGGAVITTGVKGDAIVDVACTIQSVTVLSDVSGSIVIDIWKDTYVNAAPTVADTITASAKPTLSSATKSQDSTLTGWTTAIAAGDVLRFNVDSASTVTRVTIAIKVLVS